MGRERINADQPNQSMRNEITILQQERNQSTEIRHHRSEVLRFAFHKEARAAVPHLLTATQEAAKLLGATATGRGCGLRDLACERLARPVEFILILGQTRAAAVPLQRKQLGKSWGMPNTQQAEMVQGRDEKNKMCSVRSTDGCFRCAVCQSTRNVSQLQSHSRTWIELERVMTRASQA